MSTKTAEPKTGELTFEDFFRHVRFNNPFATDCVKDAYAIHDDVPAIHAAELERLIHCAKQSWLEQCSVGVVLWGSPGTGKSHLLSRFAGWARDHHACFVYLQNLQPSASNWARTVLEYVISRLTNGKQSNFHQTNLYQLAGSAICLALRKAGLSKTESWDDARSAYDRYLEQAVANHPQLATPIAWQTFDLLFRFYQSAYQARNHSDDGIASLAVQRLSGRMLDKSELEQLGLSTVAGLDEGSALADDQEVKQTLTALASFCRFASEKYAIPFVLCFDQLENLNRDQMTAFARFSHSLLDSSSNLLLVTCGVRENLIPFIEDGTIMAANWDRLCQNEIRLKNIPLTSGRHILEIRLESFLQQYLIVDEVKQEVSKDVLFPLGRPWFEAKTANVPDLRPRDILRWAKLAWLEQVGRIERLTPAKWLKRWSEFGGEDSKKSFEERVDEKVLARLGEQLRQRQIDRASLPPSAANIAGLTRKLLEQCLNPTFGCSLRKLEAPANPLPGMKPKCDLVAEEVDSNNRIARTGVLFVCTTNKTSTAGYLRRLCDDDLSLDHVLIVTDERQPLQLGAKGTEYRQEIVERRRPDAKFIQLTFDQYAEMDAMQSVVGLACSGDLEIDWPNGNVYALNADEVIASLHRLRRYQSHVLLSELLDEKPPKDELPPDARPTLEEAKKYIASELALAPGLSTLELAEKFIKQHADMLLQSATVKRQLEIAAIQLDANKKIKATAREEGYFLLPRY